MQIVLLVLIISGLLIFLFSRSKQAQTPPQPAIGREGSGGLLIEYEIRLENCRGHYPFDDWKSYLADGMDQYTPENCQQVQKVFDKLIEKLILLGETATEREKLAHFRIATLALNEIDAHTSIIETGEREQLCELFNMIATQANLDPYQYGDGEGPASEWRDW